MKQMGKKIVNLIIIFALVLFFNTCKDEEIFIKVTSVSLNKTALTLTEGDITSLVATIIPENATNKHISWKSSNEAVASVDDEGKVTALQDGNTNIVVTTEDGHKSHTCAVVVEELIIPVTSIALDKTELTLVEGDAISLVATIIPENATNKNINWKSSNEEVASVDDEGKVTALQTGNTDIVVTTVDGEKSDTCAVVVEELIIPVTSISLNKTDLTLVEGDTTSLIATIIPENATNKHISWKSSNEAVASVDDEGKVTALQAGNTVITVTTEDGHKSHTCTVVVNTIGQTQTTLDQVIYDMVGTPFRTLGGFTKPWGSHEGYLHGLPSSWDWYHGARPLDWMENGDNTAISSWGQVFEWSEGSPVKDVRIQIRNHHMFIYTNNQWILAEDVSANIEAGHFLERNFENSGSTSPRNEKKDGGVSFPVKEDNCLHWFKKVFGSEKRSKLPEGFQAIFIRCEIRIIHGSNSKADIENAKYLAGVGADYYMTEETEGKEHTPSLAISRHKFLSTEWQTFTAYISGQVPTNVEEYRNEVLNRPLPPGVIH